MAPSTKYTAVDLEDNKEDDETKKTEDEVAVVELLDEDLVKPAAASANQKPRRSWLRILLWTIGICVAILTLVALIAGTGAYLWMRHQVQRFTIRNDHNVKQLPVENSISDIELDIALDKAKLFWDELRAGHEPEADLVITQEQLNSAIAQDHHLSGKGYVEISNGKFNLDLALPVDKLPGGNGRIFVGSASVEATSDESMASIVAQLMPQYKIHGLDFETILRGEFDVLFPSPMGDPLKVNLKRGQFLNWLVPEDKIKEQNNMASCEWIDDHHHHGCDHHGHGHHHGGHDDDDDDDHHHHGHHGHDHDHHDGHHGHHHGHHHDDDDDDDHHHHHGHHVRRFLHGHHGHHHHDHDPKKTCQEVIETMGRLESIRLEKGQIIFTPKRMSRWGAIDTVTELAPSAEAQSAVAQSAAVEEEIASDDESDDESEDESEDDKADSGIRGRRRLLEADDASSSTWSSKLHRKLARRVLRSLLA